jgi:hypothetical protein
VTILKLAFEGPKSGPDRGFTIKAFYLSEPAGDALVQIFKDDKPFREFLYPAYKIWNLAAHFKDIVDSELEQGIEGYEIAGATGFGGVIMPQPLPEEQNEKGVQS